MKWILFLVILSLTPFLQLHAGEEDALIVCEDGLETLFWNLEFIDRANYSIELGGYSVGGKVFCKLLERIQRRLEECPKLQVYIFTTSMLMEEQEKALIASLQKNYPSNFHFQLTTNLCAPFPQLHSIENHMKFLVVDEHFYSIGGTNFHDAFCSEGTTNPTSDEKQKMHAILPAATRDMDVVGRGPVAKKLRLIFYKLFALWENYEKTYCFESNPEHFKNNSYYFSLEDCPTPYSQAFEQSPKLIEGVRLKLAFSGVMDSPNKISLEYKKLIGMAKEEIVIGSLFFTPQEEIFASLLDAVNRDVKLDVITNGVWDGSPFCTRLFGWANRTNYVPLFYGRTFSLLDAWTMGDYPVRNTRIYEYEVKDVMYHKKVCVIDKRYTVIGSYNLSKKSDRADYEVVLLIDSKEAAEAVLKVLKKDLGFSRRVSIKDAEEWYLGLESSYVGYLQRLFHGFI